MGNDSDTGCCIMLGLLGLGAGKTLSKYLVIAIAVAALMFGIWAVVQSYNKALEKAAQIEAQLQVANSETEAANENTEQVAQMYATQTEQLKRSRRLSHQRAISRRQATAALALNLNSSMPDFSSVNGRLCKHLGRLQGSPTAGCMPTDTETGQADSRTYTPVATIDRTSILNLESALSQCADYIESVDMPELGR